MKEHPSSGPRWIILLIGLGILCLVAAGMDLPHAHAAQKPVRRIAIVFDGPVMATQGLLPLFKQELRQLLSAEYDVRFPERLTRSADYSAAGVQKVLRQVLRRVDLDLLIALGPLASREACLLERRPKPVIAAMVIDHVYQEIPYLNGTSGVRNLSYIEMPDTFREDLLTLNEIRPFKHLAIIGGRSLFAALPGAGHGVAHSEDYLDAEMQLVEAGPDVEQTLAALPGQMDAVYLLPIPEMALEKQEQLLNALALKRIPVFSLIGHSLVRRGALAGLNKDNWPNRFARRAALNARKILAGQDAASLPVAISRQAQLMVNMRTARITGIYPPFTVLSDAMQINVEPVEGLRQLTLTGVMDEAVLVNLDLAALGRSNAAGEEEVSRARSRLMPQLSVRASETVIDKDRADSPLSPAEQTLSGGLGLTQVIWSDEAWAGLSIERMRQLRRTMEWEQTRLDIALEAANAYLNVLLAMARQEIQLSNLRLSRSNLERARIRQELGAGGAAEVYRLESKISQERAELLAAEAQRRVAEIELNRVLAYPLEQPFALDDVRLDHHVSLWISPEIIAYANNDLHLGYLKEFLVYKGLTASPEMMQIDADIQAEKRRRLAAKRSFYSPDIALSGELSHTLDESGAGADLDTGDGPDDTDWNLSLNLSLPLWEGGGRLADKRQSRELLKTLRLQRRATYQRVEQRIRSAVHRAAASYPAIELLQTAAKASRRNFDLTADAYSRGTVPLIDLLDAQTAFLQAELSASSANYDFLLDLMELERAMGRFTFFATDKEREAWMGELQTYLQKAEAK